MSYFSTYDATGRFMRVASFPPEFIDLQDIAPELGEVGMVFEEVDGATQYFDRINDVIKDKMSMALEQAAGGLTFAIANVPVDTEVRVSGLGIDGDRVTTIVTDGTLDLTFDITGEYLVEFIHTKYLFEELTLVAT